MIGLVVVSHSARLAEGVADLVSEVAGPEVRFRATGGLSSPGHPLGTDALQVLEAIEEVWSEDGVLVLMDIGSAVLSAEAALDLMPQERRAKVVLCEAPVVEGAVAAAVQARLGATLQQALGEARSALGPKSAQLGGATPAQAEPLALEDDLASAPPLRLIVHNPLGIHARPAARLVQLAGRFRGAQVQVVNLTTGNGPVSARSLNGLAALGARKGHELLFLAAGPGASEALEAMRTLAAGGFGDGGEGAPAPRPIAPRLNAPIPGGAWVARGVSVSPGIAVGPVCHLRRAVSSSPHAPAGDAMTERGRLDSALARVRRDMLEGREAAEERAGSGAAELLDAHILSLEDEALAGAARDGVERQGLSAAAAWDRSVQAIAATYKALEDPYQRSRAADVEQVGALVRAALQGDASALPPSERGVLVAEDLSPVEVARLDPAQVLGIALARGGPTSHAAILTRALGIPALAGAGGTILSLDRGTVVALDGDAGCLYADPPADLLAGLAQRVEAQRKTREEARSASASPAWTRDGQRIPVVANVQAAADASAAVAFGAEGVGLLRTELLFVDRKVAPSEEEQLAAYRAVAEAMGGRPVVIRTLDAGGDKPLPFLDVGREANPNLGFRAIRICLVHPEIFKVQLRALVRVACAHPVRVMFPMIATPDEWRAARALLEEARAEVLARGQPVPARIETGMMVEIPSAALLAERFAHEADFFSIGTNDLTQYTLAAERGNARLGPLTDVCQPAVLALVARVAEAAHAHEKQVSVCGEAAANPLALQLFLGLGVDELSMSGPAIPGAKQLIRTLDLGVTRERALRALSLDSPKSVRDAMAP